MIIALICFGVAIVFLGIGYVRQNKAITKITDILESVFELTELQRKRLDLITETPEEYTE